MSSPLLQVPELVLLDLPLHAVGEQPRGKHHSFCTVHRSESPSLPRGNGKSCLKVNIIGQTLGPLT